MPPSAASCGPHLRARRALERDAALLRMIEAVDDVEHRGLAGAVRADDGADFAFADVEGDVADRFHAAERQRHVLDRQQHVADRDVGAAAAPSCRLLQRLARHRRLMSRIFDARHDVPLRPSSKVTSVAMSASFEPS